MLLKCCLFSLVAFDTGFEELGATLIRAITQSTDKTAKMANVIREEIDKKFDEHQSFAFSTMGETAALRIAQSVGLVAIKEADLPAAQQGFQFQKFRWDDFTEDQQMLQVNAHLETALHTLGVKLNENGGFKIIDVHSNHALLSTRLGQYMISGGTDSVLVPHQIAPIACYLQARVVFEFKKPTYSVDGAKQSPTIAEVRAQGLGEMLAASCLSNHPVLCVVTDLDDRFFMWRAQGDSITDISTTDACKALTYIADYIRSCSPDSEFD